MPESAVPSVAVRVAAFACIVVAGLCGGLIGYAFADLQCSGDCTVPDGLGALAGAAIGAGGVAVVVVLAIRAMGEWRSTQERYRPDTGEPQSLNDRKPSA